MLVNGAPASFNDFWNEVETVFNFRRYCLKVGAAINFGDDVRTQALHHVDGMRQGLNAGGINRLQVFNETENTVELLLCGFRFRRGKLDACQPRDAGDACWVQGHK